MDPGQVEVEEDRVRCGLAPGADRTQQRDGLVPIHHLAHLEVGETVRGQHLADRLLVVEL